MLAEVATYLTEHLKPQLQVLVWAVQGRAWLQLSTLLTRLCCAGHAAIRGDAGHLPEQPGEGCVSSSRQRGDHVHRGTLGRLRCDSQWCTDLYLVHADVGGRRTCLAQAFEDPAARALLSPLVPGMLGLLGRLLSAKDEDEARDVLELFILVSVWS